MRAAAFFAGALLPGEVAPDDVPPCAGAAAFLPLPNRSASVRLAPPDRPPPDRMDAAFRAVLAAAFLALPLPAEADFAGLFFAALFFAGPFPAAARCAAAFFAGDFFAAAFFADDFFAGVFFPAARSPALADAPVAGPLSPAVALPPESLVGAKSIEWTP